MPDDQALLEVLGSLRQRGAIGESSLTGSIAHAERFVATIPAGAQRLIDLGSGGGLPGLVLAVRLTGVEVVLTERRERRADLLRLACARLDFGDRVSVVDGDVVRLGRDPAFASSFDVVTARAFGDPVWTLRCATPFLAASGVVVVSEPPRADLRVRWPDEEIVALGLQPAAEQFPAVRCFVRRL